MERTSNATQQQAITTLGQNSNQIVMIIGIVVLVAGGAWAYTVYQTGDTLKEGITGVENVAEDGIDTAGKVATTLLDDTKDVLEAPFSAVGSIFGG